MGSQFALLRQLDPSTPRPYRIIESYDTSDGRRTRIVGMTWATEDEARKGLEYKREQAQKKAE